MLEHRQKKEGWFNSCCPWLTPERAWLAADWMASAAIWFALLALLATIVRVEPHALAWFEANKPAWVTELREARERQLQKRDQQQEQQRTP